mmetsp:Transcript_14113/g.23060  ORF Transcript_14113/g.23060 Transcript_14113/m.23060 type:complete len:247 (+) Transcript_14113:448-1188(+)
MTCCKCRHRSWYIRYTHGLLVAVLCLQFGICIAYLLGTYGAVDINVRLNSTIAIIGILLLTSTNAYLSLRTWIYFDIINQCVKLQSKSMFRPGFFCYMSVIVGVLDISFGFFIITVTLIKQSSMDPSIFTLVVGLVTCLLNDVLLFGGWVYFAVVLKVLKHLKKTYLAENVWMNSWVFITCVGIVVFIHDRIPFHLTYGTICIFLAWLPLALRTIFRLCSHLGHRDLLETTQEKSTVDIHIETDAE